MAVMGQGLVLMIFGMTIVYLFLWLMIIVIKYAGKFVVRFDYLIPDDAPKPKRKATTASAQPSATPSVATISGMEVKAPVPGTVLRLSASEGQQVHKGDELLVMDVMKMETPITAPCDGTVSLRVAATDKVATGAVVEGHKVVTLFGMPYGVGQLIMIPVCLILMYLAIVKGFEPLLLLPIGFGGLLLCAILLPSAVPLIGALMLGNLAKEIGASVSRIADTMANALINIVTIMLGLSVGSKLACEKFLSGQILAILALGLCAFCVGTAGGVLMAKVMNLFSSKKNRINPLIGSAGVSAVPMAARVSNQVALEDDPTNYVLMQAMGPNVSGVIGSAVVAGVLYTLCK